jgi:hypothetical protein
MVDFQVRERPDRMTQAIWTILAALGAVVVIAVVYRLVAG